MNTNVYQIKCVFAQDVLKIASICVFRQDGLAIACNMFLELFSILLWISNCLLMCILDMMCYNVLRKDADGRHQLVTVCAISLLTLFCPAHFSHLFALSLYCHFLFTGSIIQFNRQLSGSPGAQILNKQVDLCQMCCVQIGRAHV